MIKDLEKICLICGIPYGKLGFHLKKHNISEKDYYDKYAKKEGEGICANEDCNNGTYYYRGSYSNTCSHSCKMIVSHKDPKRKDIARNTMITYNKSDSHRKVASDLAKARNIDPKFIEENSVRIKTTMSTAEFRLENSKRVKSYLNDPNNSYEVRISNCKSAKTRFIQSCQKKNLDSAFLYLIKLSNSMKIGISQNKGGDSNLLNRLSLGRGKSNAEEERIFSGTVKDVAEFEFLIKTTYTPVDKTEWFSSDLFDEIISKIPNTLLPYSTLVE